MLILHSLSCTHRQLPLEGDQGVSNGVSATYSRRSTEHDKSCASGGANGHKCDSTNHSTLQSHVMSIG